MKCSKCGRFSKRLTEAMGLPLLTGSPPDKPGLAGTVPYAPFVCLNNKGHNFEIPPSIDFGFVEYQPVGWWHRNI